MSVGRHEVFDQRVPFSDIPITLEFCLPHRRQVYSPFSEANVLMIQQDLRHLVEPHHSWSWLLAAPKSDREENGCQHRHALETLMACSLAGLSLFPVLGNILAYLTGLPRRPSQIVAFAIFMGLVAYGLAQLHIVRILFSRSVANDIMTAAALSAGMIGTYVLFWIAQGVSPTGYAWLSALMTTAWLFAVVVHALSRRILTGTIQASKPKSGLKGYEGFLSVLIITIALAAYLFGPDEQGEAFMAFRGSTIQMGVCAAILGALALATLRGWYQAVALPGAIYLIVLSTARAGVLLFLGLSAITLLSLWIYGKRLDPGGAGISILRQVLLLIMWMVLITAPMALKSEHYPYFSSTYIVPEKFKETTYKLAGLVGQRVHVWDELMIRFDRLTRVVPRESSLNDIQELKHSDARWGLLLDSAKRVMEKPLGYWPQDFRSIVRTSCGPQPCSYPHNLFLEIGFHFGWIPLAFIAFGLSYWVFGVCQTVTPHYSASVRVAGIGFLGHLGFAQFSGNLLDHVVALFLGLLWMAVRILPVRDI